MVERKGSLAQVVAVEHRGEQRPFVSLDDLERLATQDPASLPKILGQLRAVWDSWHDSTGGVYVNKSAGKPSTELAARQSFSHRNRHS
jgi:hypothetical protein